MISARRTADDSAVKMKPVIQAERTGCGIASVATVAGVSYREAQRAANRLGIFAEDPRLWSETGYVRRLLRQFGVLASKTETRFTTWRTLPRLALLAIKWHRVRGRAFWHWVVFWRGPSGAVVLDSQRALRMHRRTDFGRIRPKWFIAITRIRREVGGAHTAHWPALPDRKPPNASFEVTVRKNIKLNRITTLRFRYSPRALTSPRSICRLDQSSPEPR